MGHFLSATCAEDVPRVAQDSARLLARGTLLGTYRLDQQTNACREWPRGLLPSDHASPVRSEVPVLFISGAADPVTPPYWADIAAREMPNSAHAVFAHAGHGPVASACAQRIISAFLARLAPRTLARLPYGHRQRGAARRSGPTHE